MPLSSSLQYLWLFTFHLSLPKLSSFTWCLSYHSTQHLSSFKPWLKDFPFWETFSEVRLSLSVLPLASMLPHSIPICLGQIGLKTFAQTLLFIATWTLQEQGLGLGLLTLPSAQHRAGGMVEISECLLNDEWVIEQNSLSLVQQHEERVLCYWVRLRWFLPVILKSCHRLFI